MSSDSHTHVSLSHTLSSVSLCQCRGSHTWPAASWGCSWTTSATSTSAPASSASCSRRLSGMRYRTYWVNKPKHKTSPDIWWYQVGGIFWCLCMFVCPQVSHGLCSTCVDWSSETTWASGPLMTQEPWLLFPFLQDWRTTSPLKTMRLSGDILSARLCQYKQKGCIFFLLNLK